jgi:ABC-type branched-subunit amino acid transport system substrate-binding protein
MIRAVRAAWSAAVLLIAVVTGSASAAGDGEIEIASALPLSGDESTFGKGSFEGIELAVEEANAAGTGLRIKLASYDDRSSDEEARAVARKIADSPALLVLGPALSTASLAAGPTYAEASLASLTTTATSDLITDNRTTFRIVFKNSDQGELLATYVARVLGQKSADVIYIDSGYGRLLQLGFRRVADRLGLAARYFPLAKPDAAEALAKDVAADTDHPPVVLLTLDAEGAVLVGALRRLGYAGPILGDDSFGDESFSARLADTPEERDRPGALTDGVYGLSPMILDSANAEIQEFAARYRKRFGHDPLWFSTAGYDAAKTAIAAVRAAIAAAPAGVPGSSDRDARRAAVLAQLGRLDSPANAVPGLLGPLWFDENRGRQQAIRIGRFNRNRFESAPLQIVPVTSPDTGEIASGAVFELAPGRFARLQRIVYTGVFINEISRVDLTRSSFNADFYVWLRYAQESGPNGTNPTDLTFPNLVAGSFPRNEPAEQRDTPDGTAYRLWRVQGEFRNDFDLHHYPFDHQTLSLSFFNARAAADRIVYVIDRRATGPTREGGHQPAQADSGSGPGTARAAPATEAQAAPAALAAAGDAPIASLAAFRNLTQWAPVRALGQRDNLVTPSMLGDPGRSAAEANRELSGFKMTIEIGRLAVATLAKTLLPLGLMTLIMYASLFFPHALVKEKVTVAITGALSGAVLLTAINNQLGAVGYTIAIEYVFYIFFALSVLCIVSVLSAERFRVAGRAAMASRTETATRILFLAVVAATIAAATSFADTSRSAGVAL